MTRIIEVVPHDPASTADMDHYRPGMEARGYRVRGECLDAEIPGTPGRFYFSRDAAGVRTHHVHACATGHGEITDKLAFRDYLRAHADRMREYGALKRELAGRYRDDNIGYMRGKNELIQRLLAEARDWARAGSGVR